MLLLVWHSVLLMSWAPTARRGHGATTVGRGTPTVTAYLLSNDSPFPDAHVPGASARRRDSASLAPPGATDGDSRGQFGTLATFLPSVEQQAAAATKVVGRWVTDSKRPSAFCVEDVTGPGMFTQQKQQLAAIVPAVEEKLGMPRLFAAGVHCW